MFKKALPFLLLSGLLLSSTQAEELPPQKKKTQAEEAPLLKRKVGLQKIQDLGQLEIPIEAWQRLDGHLILRLSRPALINRDLRVEEIHVQGARYGFAAFDDQHLYLRLQGPEPLAVPLELKIWGREKSYYKSDHSWSISLNLLPSKAAQEAALEGGWREAARSHFLQHKGRQSNLFLSFAAERVRGEQLKTEVNSRRWRKTDLAQTMDLYTGLTSVQEALQMDRALRLGGKIEERNLKIEDLKGIPLAEHPWEAMMAELPGQPKAIIEPLAAHLPADMIYLHFHDLRRFVRLSRDLKAWGSPLIQALEGRGGFNHFTERYEEELIIEQTLLSEQFGHLAVQGVALLASDPLFREGTDLTLAFHLKNAALLEGTLANFESKARKLHPDLREMELNLMGHKVRLLKTPDGRLQRHSLRLGEVLFLSNSPGALTRIIQVHEGQRPALSKSGDFRYMRSLYPFSKEQEEGFLFIGDALVASVISPRTKILQARRMRAQSELLALSFSALLYGWLEGSTPTDSSLLLSAGYLQKEELSHSSGEAIRFDPLRGPSSALGRADRMRPLIDWPFSGKISAAEQKAYERFKQGYQRYWRSFIDPIAVQIRFDGQRLALDARMLPLIDSSEYDEVARLVGKQRLKPLQPRDGLRWAFAVGEESQLRRELDGLARNFRGVVKFGFGWLGEWIIVGAAEHPGLWDISMLSSGDYEEKRLNRRSAEGPVLARAPLYVILHLRNKLALAAMLTGLRSFSARSLGGLVEWIDGQSYRGATIVTLQERKGSSMLGARLAIHYAILNDMLLLALNRKVLEGQIDNLLDASKESPLAELQSTLMLNFSKENSWLSKALQLELLNPRRGQAAATRAYEILSRGRPGLKDLRAEGLAWLGFEPMGPLGGVFSHPRGEPVKHSVYGSLAAPIRPEIPLEGSPVKAIFDRLNQLQMGVAIEGEGRHKGLHARLIWQWKK